MHTYDVRVHRSAQAFPRVDHLAWRIAEVAADRCPVDDDVAAEVINRIIDTAAVAIASGSRSPVVAARDQARAHPHGPGATVFGLPGRYSPEWAAWANGVAVRELDFHDTYLGAEYAHPGDNIPPLVAVAQHTGAPGMDLVRGIVTGYEVQIDLARGMDLHRHRIDHVAHLGPSVAAGIGTLLGLPLEVTYQAIGQALHTTTATRQTRKGTISSWKAYAPAHASKMAIEAVDRSMRGESSPAPIWEGEDAVMAWLLDGPDAYYSISLPAAGEPRRSILQSYTKAHSAEYQAQAWIDLARRLHDRRPDLADPANVSSIEITTSEHTHRVIGSGSGDPQKYDPDATRETLDHSVPYIFAVALQDGEWHHERSYSAPRAHRPDTVELWRKVTTVEDPHWTRRYHSTDPAEQAFGGRVEIVMADGTVVTDEIAVADAHPYGAHPFKRADYVAKFHTLTDGIVALAEAGRFIDLVERLPELPAAELSGLTVRPIHGTTTTAHTKGLF